MVSLKKVGQVDNLIYLLQNHKNFILIKFDRTAHQKLEEIRRALKKTNSNLKVVKNTLLEKAVNKLSNSEKLMSEFHKKAFPNRDTTALLTLDKAWDRSLSEFNKFIKQEKTLEFKVGILDEQIYASDNLKRIAGLPPKEQLIAKVIGWIKAPLNNLVYAMKFNTNKLVYILNAKVKKGGDN